jgi:hypothetical protein
MREYERFVEEAIEGRMPAGGELLEWAEDLEAATLGLGLDPTTPRERRLGNDFEALCDVRLALAILGEDDPAASWNHGLVLAAIGRPEEAAYVFMRAAALFKQAVVEGGEEALTGDESDWSDSSLYHAARQLARGRPLPAALLREKIRDEADRAELEPLLQAGLSAVSHPNSDPTANPS